jgi:hypothetical protein
MFCYWTRAEKLMPVFVLFKTEAGAAPCAPHAIWSAALEVLELLATVN